MSEPQMCHIGQHLISKGCPAVIVIPISRMMLQMWRKSLVFFLGLFQFLSIVWSKEPTKNQTMCGVIRDLANPNQGRSFHLPSHNPVAVFSGMTAQENVCPHFPKISMCGLNQSGSHRNGRFPAPINSLTLEIQPFWNSKTRRKTYWKAEWFDHFK